MTVKLLRVVDALPAGFEALRAEARTEGHSMLDTLASEWARGAARFDRPGEMLMAAFSDDVLAGIGGLTLEPAIPSALRARRFYVALAYRRTGIGKALAGRILADALRSGVTVTCNAAAGSERFWEALGFVPDRRDGRTHLLAR